MFHFDCQAWEESEAAAAVDPEPEREAAATSSKPASDYSSGATSRLARRLELDPEQTEALQPIMEGAMARSRQYWMTARDEFCAMQEDFHRNVNAMLRPEQAARFDEWTKELAERGRHRGGRHRGARKSDGTETGGCR